MCTSARYRRDQAMPYSADLPIVVEVSAAFRPYSIMDNLL